MLLTYIKIGIGTIAKHKTIMTILNICVCNFFHRKRKSRMHTNYECWKNRFFLPVRRLKMFWPYLRAFLICAIDPFIVFGWIENVRCDCGCLDSGSWKAPKKIFSDSFMCDKFAKRQADFLCVCATRERFVFVLLLLRQKKKEYFICCARVTCMTKRKNACSKLRRTYSAMIWYSAHLSEVSVASCFDKSVMLMQSIN